MIDVLCPQVFSPVVGEALGSGRGNPPATSTCHTFIGHHQAWTVAGTVCIMYALHCVHSADSDGMTRKEFARSLRKWFRQQNGYVNPLPEDADHTLDAVEAKLGFQLPRMVRFVFKHIGEDFINPEWSADEYAKLRDDGEWPERMLPLTEEGCGIWLCLDCSHTVAPVIRWRGDYANEGEDELVFEHASPSFAEFLRSQLPRE
jgi:hypothetical protein